MLWIVLYASYSEWKIKMKVYVNGKNKRSVAAFEWQGNRLVLTRKSGKKETIMSSKESWELDDQSTDKEIIVHINEL